MSDVERIMLECRYVLSLNKSYQELSKLMHINIDIIYDDLNNKLKSIDSILYKRTQNCLKK